MALISFKLPGHRVFDYQPRYYDPRKEALQSKMDSAEREAALEGTADYESKLKRGYMSRNIYFNKAKRQKTYSLVRVVIIFMALTLFVAALLLDTRVGTNLFGF